MNPAKVELFKRIEPSDELVSINQTLALCTDIFSSKEESVNNLDQVNNVTNEKTLKPLNLQTDLSSESPYLKSLTNGIPVQCFSLQEENRISKHYSVITPDGIGEQVDDVLDLEDIKPPVLPSVGEFFDVHIVHTAHPHYFICQSWKHGAELDLLYEEMQSFYSSEENTIDMDDCLLKRGQFYAGKYNDEWKRVWVSDIISEDMVSVYFVDYGGFQLIGLTDLQPLWKYFRCFPYQAIPAELYGVEPREKDWNPMHCMQFQKMVEGKEFVSVIKKKMPDNNTGFVGEKLSLCLIDTSHPDRDIYIDKLLHDAGIVKLVFQR
ncbi:tudor domain-containing protein 7-like [Centruroides sculpturatus]|uniref:tudor domain-containing protein 7-like n=1 Tax=Centruroides sculpturatus TaxID=218467 RepID=UPI000C6E84F3|nr:tudor domain-containing protein 7-like [Centruroides sculpturatus]